MPEKWHLNVPERNLLPKNGIAGSKLILAIETIIAEASRYPRDWSPDSYFDGILIVQNEDGFLLYECRETGMGQFTHIGQSQVKTLEQGVERFLAAVFSPNDIDGVLIDWKR